MARPDTLYCPTRNTIIVNTILIGLMGCFLLASLMISIYCCFDSHKIFWGIGEILIFIGPFGLIGLYALNKTLIVSKSSNDYLKLTRKGIELNLHLNVFFWEGPMIVFLEWRQIESFDVVSRPRRGVFLVLKLVNEMAPYEYNLSILPINNKLYQDIAERWAEAHAESMNINE